MNYRNHRMGGAIACAAGVLLGLGVLRVRGADAAAAPKTGDMMIDGPPVDPQMYAQVNKRDNAGVRMAADKMPNNGRDGKHPENFTSPTKFAAFVPDSYKPDGSWGLLVYISPFDARGVSADMKKICSKHHLLGITPQDTNNAHHQPWRVSLALMAVQEMKRDYKFRADRTYLAGLSGGARASSQAVILFPDVFDGAICNCGVDFVMVNGEPKQDIDTFDALPEVVRRAAEDDRLYLFTGSKDPNHDETQKVYDWLQHIGFKHVAFFSQDGAGHGDMSEANFEKGLEFLDAPLDAAATAKMKQATALEKRGALGPAIVMYQKAAALAAGAEAGDKAEQEADQMVADYQTALAAVKTVIEAGDRRKSVAAIAGLTHKYAPYADADVATLRKEMLRQKPSTTPRQSN